MEETKTCSKCGRVLPATPEFFPVRYTSKGELRLRAECKKCDNARSMEWREKNRERARETQMKFRQKEYEARGIPPKKYSTDDLQKSMQRAGITQWQVAVAMGMHSSTLSAKFRNGTLTSAEREKIKHIIEMWEEITI